MSLFGSLIQGIHLYTVSFNGPYNRAKNDGYNTKNLEASSFVNQFADKSWQFWRNVLFINEWDMKYYFEIDPSNPLK